MKVELREVTRDNWRECVRLRVRPDQENYVASNAYSLAESKFDPGCKPLAIYNDEGEMVGFAMYVFDEADKNWWIARIMIDRKCQGKGYGRAAMNELIERIAGEDPNCRMIALSYEPDNDAARKLYASLGFHETGEALEGEVVARLRVKPDAGA